MRQAPSTPLEDRGVHRHEQLVRALFGALEERDFEAADGYLTPDCEIIGSTLPLDEDRVSRTLSERSAQLDASYEHWSMNLRDIVPAPDGRLVGIVASSMNRHDLHSGFAALTAAIFEFRDGLVRRVVSYPLVEQALADAGLRAGRVAYRAAPREPGTIP